MLSFDYNKHVSMVSQLHGIGGAIGGAQYIWNTNQHISAVSPQHAAHLAKLLLRTEAFFPLHLSWSYLHHSLTVLVHTPRGQRTLLNAAGLNYQ